jgi:AI-2 transport protein TqsA
MQGNPAPADRGGVRAVPQPIGGLVVVVLVLAAAVLLREVAALVVPLLFGGFLALVALPMVGALARRGARRPVAVGITVAIVLVVLVATMAIVALSIGELVVLIPSYEARLAQLVEATQAWLLELGIQVDLDAIRSLVPPEQIAALIRPLASAVSNAGLAILVVVLTMTYAIVGSGSVRARAERLLGAHHAVLIGFERFGADLRRYVIVRAQLGLFAAVLSFGLLAVLSVPLPALWAFLVFAASFIPNVGVVLAVIPPTILAILDSGVGAGIAVLAGYVVINFVQDNFLQPFMLGTELNLTPLVVFTAVIVWAWILGPAGALLAVPLTVGLVAILEAFPNSRPIAALMRAKLDAPAGFTDEPTG